MARRYNSSSDDDGDRNYRRRRRHPSSGSSDSDRHTRGNRERKSSVRVEREDRVEVGRERSSRPDREEEERETGRSDSDKEKMRIDRYGLVRERKVSGRVEREKRDDLSSDRVVEVGRERSSREEERETGRSDSGKEKMRIDRYGLVREREVSGRVEREKRDDLSPDYGRGREGKRSGVVEREEGVEGSSDSERETLRRDRNGRGGRERKESGVGEREKGVEGSSVDSDKEKMKRDGNGRGRERRESGIVEREKGVEGSSDSDKKKMKRDGNGRGGRERKESGVGEREKGVEGSSDSDKEKMKRDGNGRGRERKGSGIVEREKGVEGSSDSDKEKMKRDGNGRGRERKGSGIVEREKGDEGSSDSEREKPRRGDRNRRDRDEKRSRRIVTETGKDGNNRDRKRDRYRKERHEKDNSDEEGEILATETRKRRDRERRESRHERDREDKKHVTNDSMPKKQSLSQLGDVNADVASGRSGGVYIPPFKLARMMKEVDDKCSVEYQRLTWDALRKSINGLVNKVNATNIKNIVPELFSENLVRGRGLFCRSCMKSQMASPAFTDVFAALAAVVNTKFPQIGYLLLKRIVLQLKRAYKRNDKPQLLAAVKFIAHLVNQQVVHELVALELLTLLLDKPTDDSVEVAVGFVTECGSILQDLCPRGLHGIFESFRGILHEGEIDKRVQFLIEGLFAIRKAKFEGHPAVRPELDLVELEDQLTHEISLAEDEDLDPETILDIFRPDPDFLKNEKIYEDHKKNILGDDSEDKSDSDAGSDDEDDEDDDEDEEEEEERMKIQDETETNLVNLRRTIYLTIMSSVDFEEAGHKLLKIKLEPGQEMELCIMLLECCSQERTYLRYYGLLGQRFCLINRIHQENFEKSFVQQYSMIHRLETNKLRNVAKFFAHLLGTNALPWHVLAYIRLTEEDTTSSSRIFIKILFQELSEHLGIRLLNERLNDPTMQDSFESIFPRDNPKNTRFAINFFTSIGLGGITESLREYLKNMPRLIMQQQKPASDSDDESSDSSSSSGSDSSSSESESSSSSEDERERKRKRRK